MTGPIAPEDIAVPKAEFGVDVGVPAKPVEWEHPSEDARKHGKRFKLPKRGGS